MNKKIVKPNLFLVEMMISVLFFALSSAVCLSLFAKAHVLSVESSDLTHAINKTVQAAECIKDSPENVVSVMNGTKIGENQYKVYYDSDWNIISDKDGMVYEMSVVIGQYNPVLVGEISVKKQEKQIYGIEVKKYNG